MPRFKLTLAYDGRPFHGWQIQNQLPTVQQGLEAAITAFSGETPLVYGAGRTDSGVHANGQTAHMDLEAAYNPEKIQGAMNYHLRPLPISVLAVEHVHDDFHARFDAILRGYTYKFLNRRGPPTYRKGLVWHVTAPLDVEAMQDGANNLLGTHDFTTFRDSQCQAKSPVKSIDSISLTIDRDEIHMKVCARSFLHRQIRSIAGSLVEVGRKKHPPQWIGDILKATHRSKCGPVAPAEGLYLEFVQYPADPTP